MYTFVFCWVVFGCCVFIFYDYKCKTESKICKPNYKCKTMQDNDKTNNFALNVKMDKMMLM